MPRRAHIALLTTALALGLLSAVGLAACGEGDGSSAAETLDAPPLTVDAGATLPAGAATTGTTTTSSTDTTAAATGGALDSSGGGATGASGTDATGTPTPPDTGGGAPSTGGGDTTTQTQPSNPGGAAPDYQSFCDQNPGAC